MSDERFWKRVRKSEGCWEYMGARNTCGYGWITRNYKQMNAQRWAWILTRGPITQEAHVLHTCDNRACQDNMLDRAQRRRTKTQKLSAQDVHEIQAMRANGVTCQAIADKYHISNGHASEVSRRLCHVRD